MNPCLYCGQPIEEDEWIVISECGPLGIFEPEEIGNAHISCYEEIECSDDDED